MSAIVARQPAPTVVERLDELSAWVIAAPVEEVCWRLTEIGSAREWLRARKSATELRQKAVRLELVALSRVGLAGLASKIAGDSHLRSAATWLATLADDEFARVLGEIDGEFSPISLYRRAKKQMEDLASSLKPSGESEWKARTRWSDDEAADARLRSAVSEILDEIVQVGEPFTVSAAADVLAERLGLDLEIRAETADGLREMVRSAIRGGDRTGLAYNMGVLPAFFTVESSDSTYTRVPLSKATLGHLVAHEHEVRKRAEASLRRADQLEEALRSLIFEVSDCRANSVSDLYEIDETALLETPIDPLIKAQYRAGRTASA